jgi:hypothetical protein
MSDIRIMWGYNDKDDTTKGWFIKISDPLTGELWAEKLMDIPGYNLIELRGSDVEYIHYMIDNLSVLEDRCRLEKYEYDKNVEEIQNLSPSDF